MEDGRSLEFKPNDVVITPYGMLTTHVGLMHRRVSPSVDDRRSRRAWSASLDPHWVGCRRYGVLGSAARSAVKEQNEPLPPFTEL